MLTYGLTITRTRVVLTECPYCLWRPGRGRTTMREHIRSCHPERLRADAVYLRSRAAGESIEDARAAYNRVVAEAHQGTEGYRK